MSIDEKATFIVTQAMSLANALVAKGIIQAYEAAKAKPDENPFDPHGALDGLILPERDQTVPAEQQGVFRKYVVRRVDGSDEPDGKHHGCEYFVLDTDHDQHAKPALSAYALSCLTTHPELSRGMVKRYDLSLPDIESVQQEYYKRGWKEAQAHYTKPDDAMVGRVKIEIMRYLGPSDIDYSKAHGWANRYDIVCRNAAKATIAAINDYMGEVRGASGIPEGRVQLPASPATQQPGAQWRDIGSAPKDGSLVDLYFPDTGRKIDCFYDALNEEPGWVWNDENVDLCSYQNQQPTHWMPLPHPPTAIQEQGE